MESQLEENEFELVEVHPMEPTTPKPKSKRIYVRKLKPLPLPVPEPPLESVVVSKPTRTPRLKQPQQYLVRPPLTRQRKPKPEPDPEYESESYDDTVIQYTFR